MRGCDTDVIGGSGDRAALTASTIGLADVRRVIANWLPAAQDLITALPPGPLGAQLVRVVAALYADDVLSAAERDAVISQLIVGLVATEGKRCRRSAVVSARGVRVAPRPTRSATTPGASLAEILTDVLTGSGPAAALLVAEAARLGHCLGGGAAAALSAGIARVAAEPPRPALSVLA
jgi:hypothetical protein